MNHAKKSYLWMIVLVFWLGRGVPAFAQSPISDVQSTALFQFGQKMRFSLQATSNEPIDQLTLFYNTPTSPETIGIELEMPATRQIAISHEVNLREHPLPPFATVTFWWVLSSRNGEQWELPAEQISYRDNRFRWFAVSQSGIKIHTEGDATLAQTAHDVLGELLPQIERIIPAELPENLQIYLYPTASDLQAALALNGYSWVGGHTDPKLGVILLAVPNSVTADVTLRRSLPHELSHQLLYQATTSHYEDVPAWFDEGLATYFELEENPNHSTILAQAVSDNRQIPFQELCLSFPATEDEVVLAYAQSGSLVSFIQARYGDHVLTEFVHAFADGLRCEAAVQRVLGVSLHDVEAIWLDRQTNHSLPALIFRQYGWWFFVSVGWICRHVVDGSSHSIGLQIMRDNDNVQLARFEALFQRGTELLIAGNPHKALPLLEKSHQLLPDHFDAGFNLSSAYILANKFKKAVPILEKLADQEPDNATLWQNLGAAYLGNPVLATDEAQQRAIHAFKRAIAIDQIAPNVAYNIGLVYRDRQEVDEAIHWFTRAVQADPMDDSARRQIARLEASFGEEG